MIEMLAAVAVLAFMFTMMSQMLSTISQSCSEGRQRANNFAKARVMLDLMARDIQSGIYRSDLSWAVKSSPSTPIFALYTQRPGIGGGTATRNVSLVQYEISNSDASTLQRGDYGITWSGDASTIPFNNSTYAGAVPQSRDAVPGVLACAVRFIQGDGTIVSTFNSSVRAISISMAVVDDNTLTILKRDSGSFSTLQGKFTTVGVPNTERSLKYYWEKKLETDNVWSSYPRPLGTGLKIFERYVPINPQ